LERYSRINQYICFLSNFEIRHKRAEITAKAFLMRDQVRTSYNISPVEMVSKAIGGVSPVAWVSETIGGVAPIGWVSPATILIDEALNDYDVVWAAAGHPHAVYPTSFAELLAITSAKPMVVGE
jgi:hypothetical protein